MPFLYLISSWLLQQIILEDYLIFSKGIRMKIGCTKWTLDTSDIPCDCKDCVYAEKAYERQQHHYKYTDID